MNNTTVKVRGIGIGSLLTVLFVGLKLTGHISWSWIWVVSPLWIPLAVIIGFLMVGIFTLVIVSMVEILSKK